MGASYKTSTAALFVSALLFTSACTSTSAQKAIIEAGVASESIIAELSPDIWETPVPIDAELTPTWGRLDDPELQALLKDGLLSNLSLEQAVLRLQQAHISVEQARTALRPRFALGSGQASLSQARQGSLSERYSVGGSASYQVDLWGRINNGVTLSELLLERQEIALETLRISIAQSIALTYLDLRVQDEFVRLQQQQIEIQREQLRLSGVRLQAGAITRLSVDQIDVSIQRLLSDLENLRATRNDLERRLATLLGRPPGDLRIQPRDFQTYPLPRVAPEAPAFVISQRPDIRLAMQDLASAGISLDTVRKAWLPALSASSSASQSGASLNDLLTSDNIFASIGIAASILLYDNGDRARTIENSELSQEQVRIGLEQIVLSSLQDVERVLTRQERNLRQIEIQAIQAEAQARVTRITQAQYDTGAASAFDLIREQQNALNIQQTQVRNWAEGARTYIDALGVFGIAP